ncbi:Os08g0204632, partial [Oryza sativa Japonica Group]
RRLKQARVVVGGRGALAAPSAGTISSAGAVSPYWIRIRSRASTFFILVEPSPLGSTVAVCILLRMESSKTQSQGSASVPKNPAMSSCRKKKSDDVTFLEDLKDHIDEFIHASMDEHKHCFKNTIQKMFGMSKVVAERSAEAKEAEVESALPLQTSVSQ